MEGESVSVAKFISRPGVLIRKWAPATVNILQPPALLADVNRLEINTMVGAKGEDLGFTMQESNGAYTILHYGKKATTLRGFKAQQFREDVEHSSFAEQQQIMARLTGNYKHGNEKTARNHPRNRGKP